MGYLGTPPQSGFITTAKQRVTSSTNNYVDLDHSISSIADVIVFVNFVKQDTTNLTLTTSTRITLGGTLVSSDVVEIHYLGKAVNTQTPGTATVTNDMLAGSIALDKLSASGTKSSSTFLRGDNTFASPVSTFGTEYFACNRTSPETFTASSIGKIGINNVLVDVGNNFDTTNYRYTAPATGVYFFYAFGMFDADSNSELPRMELYFKKNNSNYVAESRYDFRSNNARIATGNITSTLSLSANDYIEWWAEVGDASGNPIFTSHTGLGDSGSGNQFGGWRIA